MDGDVAAVWPTVPDSLNALVERFVGEHPADQVASIADTLWEATHSWNNETIYFDADTRWTTIEEVSRVGRLAQKLSSLGLIIEHRSHDSPLTGSLTPMAWQLLLRGHFGSPMWNTATSIVASISYDASLQTLDVVFNDHTGRRYEIVPAHIYEDLMKAGSKDQYFSSYIEGRYGYSGIVELRNA